MTFANQTTQRVRNAEVKQGAGKESVDKYKEHLDM